MMAADSNLHTQAPGQPTGTAKCSREGVTMAGPGERATCPDCLGAMWMPLSRTAPPPGEALVCTPVGDEYACQWVTGDPPAGATHWALLPD